MDFLIAFTLFSAIFYWFTVIMFARFILPDEFDLALLTLELEFVKKGTKDEQVQGFPILWRLELMQYPLHFIVSVSYRLAISKTYHCFCCFDI